MHDSALDARDRAQAAEWVGPRKAALDELEEREATAWALLGTGAAAAVAAVLWFALDRPERAVRYRPPLVPVVTPGGFSLQTRF